MNLSDPGRSAHLWRAPAEPIRAVDSAPARLARTLCAAFVLLGAPALSSCKGDKPQVLQERGIRDSNGQLLRYDTPAPPPPKAAAAPRPDPFGTPAFAPAPAPTAPTPADAAAQEDVGDAGSDRDLSAELSSALTSVTSCVDLPRAAQQPDGRLVIRVSASVLGSGRISRLSVMAPGQPNAALSCMEREALRITLRDGVPNAPINVTGTTELQIKNAGAVDAAVRPSPVPVAPTEPVVPGNPNVAQPDTQDIARPDTESLAGPPQ